MDKICRISALKGHSVRAHLKLLYPSASDRWFDRKEYQDL